MLDLVKKKNFSKRFKIHNTLQKPERTHTYNVTYYAKNNVTNLKCVFI